MVAISPINLTCKDTQGEIVYVVLVVVELGEKGLMLWFFGASQGKPIRKYLREELSIC